MLEALHSPAQIVGSTLGGAGNADSKGSHMFVSSAASKGPERRNGDGARCCEVQGNS